MVDVDTALAAVLAMDEAHADGRLAPIEADVVATALREPPEELPRLLVAMFEAHLGCERILAGEDGALLLAHAKGLLPQEWLEHGPAACAAAWQAQEPADVRYQPRPPDPDPPRSRPRPRCGTSFFGPSPIVVSLFEEARDARSEACDL